MAGGEVSRRQWGLGLGAGLGDGLGLGLGDGLGLGLGDGMGAGGSILNRVIPLAQYMLVGKLPVKFWTEVELNS